MKQATRPSSRIRVLVVEDEALSRHALCQVLHRCGFFSAGASDGSQALDMVKFFHPQVIIMDLRMPKLDGFEATRRLKADQSTANIPVLALTGSTDPEDRRQALDAGVDTFLTKPINLDQLMLYLRQHEVEEPARSENGNGHNGNSH
jgi:CheY-like chemotaxis protein